METLWGNKPPTDIVQAAPMVSFANCFLWLVSHSTNEEKEVICSSIWACWFVRNIEVMEGKQCNLAELPMTYINMLKNYQAYTSNVCIIQTPIISSYQSWCAPNEGWININFDAHIGDNMLQGLGVLARDHNENVMFTATRRCTALRVFAGPNPNRTRRTEFWIY